jgi:hypothetical protein
MFMNVPPGLNPFLKYARSERLSNHATGRGVYISRYLERTYGKGRWRKRKGIATVKLADGTVCDAEIHWFEAHSVGRKDFKIKKVFR